MNTRRAFHDSLYLCMLLASAALAWSEVSFLPELPVIAAFTTALLLVSWRIEGRWELSLTAANYVGAAMGAVLTLWIGWQFVRPADSLMSVLPFPTSLLPYLGPVVMVLIPAKLLRSKHDGDYWAMYGLSVIAVALGCAMAGDALFGILLAAWVVVFVWSLILFQYDQRMRESYHTPGEAVPSRRPTVVLAVRWSLGLAVASLALFLLSPRPGGSRFEFYRTMRMETGMSGDSQVDLSRTGSLNVNRELAFSVYAEDDKNAPKSDLPNETRWRSLPLQRYEGGKWTSEVGSSLNLREKAADPARVSPERVNPGYPAAAPLARLPYPGVGQYFLTFRLKYRALPTNVAADPIWWSPRQAPPLVSILSDRLVPWQQMMDGRFASMIQNLRQDIVYAQVMPPDGISSPDVGPPMMLDNRPVSDPLVRMPPLVGLRKYTRVLFDRLVEQGRIPARVAREVDALSGSPLPIHHESIARAFENHLSNSGEFSYTLDLKRSARRIDPAEDFLLNTKSGHCERFATALTLMLRAMGVPAQMVLGFKGCENLGEGQYEVRQYHAHAWVEILVKRGERWHWVTFDPTPSGGGSDEDGNLLNSVSRNSETFFQRFILSYNSESRQKSFDAIVEWATSLPDRIASGDTLWPVFVALAVIAALVVLFVRGSRRRSSPALSAGTKALLYRSPACARLFSMLEAAGIRPAHPGTTPAEFAAQVGDDWSADPALAAIADIPARIVDACYRETFAGRTPDAAQTLALETDLRTVERTLSAKPGR